MNASEHALYNAIEMIRACVMPPQLTNIQYYKVALTNIIKKLIFVYNTEFSCRFIDTPITSAQSDIDILQEALYSLIKYLKPPKHELQLAAAIMCFQILLDRIE